MSPSEEVRREAEALARQSEYRREFIVLQTVFLSVLPLVYSFLTFTYGDRLWTPDGGQLPVYQTALSLPYAPESWGSFFALVGLGSLVSLFTRHDRALALVALLAALIVCSFMVAFVSDFVRYDAPQALPAALVHGVVGLSFFNLSRLAWVSAKNEAQL